MIFSRRGDVLKKKLHRSPGVFVFPEYRVPDFRTAMIVVNVLTPVFHETVVREQLTC